MRGSIWSVVALGTGIAFLPLVVPNSGTDPTGDAIYGLISAIAPVLGIMFAVAVFGLLIVLLGFDNGGI